ncbi:MAG: thiamine pyrophosphate-dependent enzyme, partial [Acidimicrobiales bacterium]
VSAAVGLAATRADRSAVLLTGDLALLHDLGGLTAAARLGLHLTVVCVDNDGGGIFSMLPIADRAAEADFERLFRTPHGLDLVALDGFGGIRAHPVRTAAALAALVSDTSLAPEPGVDLAVVTVDGDADLAQRRSIEREVARAVTKGGP